MVVRKVSHSEQMTRLSDLRYNARSAHAHMLDVLRPGQWDLGR